MAEPCPEKGRTVLVERLSWRAQYVVHLALCRIGYDIRCTGTLRSQRWRLFLLAGNAFAAHLRRRGSQRNPRGRHAHHLVRDAVRLTLQWIIDAADFEFRLNETREARRRKMRRRLKPLRTVRG